jgi:hypothetical protein
MALSGGGSRRRRRARKCVTSISQIKANASKSAVSTHFFDKGSMRFFGSRVIDKVIPGKTCRCSFFVTSEKRPRSNDARAYTVRMACGGKISTVGGFQAYRTRARALTAAKKLAKKKG